MIEKNPGIKSLLIKSAGDRETAGELDQRAHKALWITWQTVNGTLSTPTKHFRPARNQGGTHHLYPKPHRSRGYISRSQNLHSQPQSPVQTREHREEFQGRIETLSCLRLWQRCNCYRNTETAPKAKVQAGNWLIVKDSKRNKNGESTRKHALSWATHSPLSLQLIKGKVKEGLDHSLWWHRSQKINTMGHFLLRDKVVRRPSAGSWSQRKHSLGGELIYHWHYLLKGLWCILQHRKTQILPLVCILKDTKYLKWDKCIQRLLTCFSPFSHGRWLISPNLFSGVFPMFHT